MSTEKHNALSLHSWRDVVSVLWRYRLLSGVAFCGALALAVLYILYAPREYRSTARYLVKLGREAVGIDPTASMGETMGLYRTSESVVKSVHEILLSQDLTDRVVERLGEDKVLGRETGDGPATPPSAVSRFVGSLKQVVSSLDPISNRERARMEVQENLSFESPAESNVIIVSYDAKSAKLAHEVMEVISEEFIKEHARISSTAGSLEFFDEQGEISGGELNRLTDELKTKKNEFGVGSIEGRVTTLEGQIEGVRGAILANGRDLVANQSRLAAITESLESTPENVDLESKSGVDNEATAGMRQQLYEIELLENELLSRYEPDHPKILAVRKQLEKARSVFAEMEASRTELSRGTNPLHRQLKSESVTLEATLASLEAEKSLLGEQLEELEEELTTLNEQSAELYRLEVEVSIARTKYETNSRMLEQARLYEALSEKEISSIGVIQQPDLTERPSKPSKKMVAALGLLAAFGGAICLPFMLEYLRYDPRKDQRAHSTDLAMLRQKERPKRAKRELDVVVQPDLVGSRDYE